MSVRTREERPANFGSMLDNAVSSYSANVLEEGISPMRMIIPIRKISAIFIFLFSISSSLLMAAHPQSSEWKPLFNGKELNWWKRVGPGSMTVENGLIQTHGGMGLLYWTAGKLGRCRLRVVYKMRDHNSNSGAFLRIPIEPREPWMPVHYGYEVQIDNQPEDSKEDEYHVNGTLYSLTKTLERTGKPGPEWNTMLITLDGPHTVVE